MDARKRGNYISEERNSPMPSITKRAKLSKKYVQIICGEKGATINIIPRVRKQIYKSIAY